MINWLRSLDWGLIFPIVLLATSAVCMAIGACLTYPDKVARAAQWVLRPILRRIWRATE